MTNPKPEHSFMTVDIYDQTYHLSGPDLHQVQQLAARVDARMREVAASGRTADSLRVAVLAALNLADELSRAEARLRQLEGSSEVTDAAAMHTKADNLRRLLDSVLEEESKPE